MLKQTLFLQANSVLNNLASGYGKVSCMIWEGRDVKKVDLNVLDIGWTIIQKVGDNTGRVDRAERVVFLYYDFHLCTRAAPDGQDPLEVQATWRPRVNSQCSCFVTFHTWRPQVDKIPEMCDYIVLGVLFTLAMSLLPVVFRAYHVKHKLSVGIQPGEILENSILLVGHHWK